MVQGIEEHLPFEIYVCLHPKGEVLYECLVNPSMELYVMPYTVCCEIWLIYTMFKGESSLIIVILKNICIQCIGIEEHHVDILVVDVSLSHRLVLNEEWIFIFDKYSLLFDITNIEEEIEEEKSSDDKNLPLEKDQNARKNAYEDTLQIDLTFEYFFKDQLAKITLEEYMKDEG